MGASFHEFFEVKGRSEPNRLDEQYHLVFTFICEGSGKKLAV